MECVIFESDAKVLMDAIHSNKADISKFGSIIDYCKTFLQSQQTFKVYFVKRQANKITNTFEKACNLFLC